MKRKLKTQTAKQKITKIFSINFDLHQMSTEIVKKNQSM